MVKKKKKVYRIFILYFIEKNSNFTLIIFWDCEMKN